MQVKKGSPTVAVAAIGLAGGIERADFKPYSASAVALGLVGGTPTNARETRALPKTNCIVLASSPTDSRCATNSLRQTEEPTPGWVHDCDHFLVPVRSDCFSSSLPIYLG